MYRNLFFIAAGCLATLLVFVLAFSGDARPRADFVWNNGTEPQTLDPLRISGQPEGSLAIGLFEGLTTYHPKTLEPIPAVARSWQVAGLEYTFQLRQDSWWVKGTEIFDSGDGPCSVTANDFVFSWQAHAFPETGSQYGYLFHIIEGYESYQKAVEEQWARVVGQYGPGKERPERGIVNPVDLEPGDRDAVLDFRRKLWEETVGIKTTGDFTLTVKLRAAAPYFLMLTSFYTYLPIPRQAREKHGDKWILPENIVTNGPYFLETWRFNSFVRLRKNRHHWEGPEYVQKRLAEIPTLPQTLHIERERDLLARFGSFRERGLEVIEALAVEEQNTALNLYLNGDVDKVRDIPINVVGELIEASRSEAGLPHIHSEAQLAVYFYNLNLKHPAFQGGSGRKLRRALALAVDRVGLIETVTRQNQEPAYGMVPPGVPNYPRRPILGSGNLEADFAEARRLIQEVRAERGALPRLKILYNTSENHAKIGAFVQAGWRKVLGLECELTNQEWGVFLESRASGNFDIARMGWIGDYPDANTFLDLYTSGNPNNDPSFKNQFFDRLIQRYAAHIDEVLRDPPQRHALLEDVRAHTGTRQRGSEVGADAIVAAIAAFDSADEATRPDAAFAVRSVLLQVAEQVLMDEAPVIPLYFYTTTQLWPPELQGIHTNLMDTHPPRFLRWRDGQRPTGARYKDFPRLRP